MKVIIISIIALLAVYVSSATVTCPKFTCTTNKDHCINSTTLVDLPTKNKTVELSKCENDTFICPYTVEFWSENTFVSKCKIPEPGTVRERYPGEPCEKDLNCVKDSKCDTATKKCTGKNFNETCTINKDCVAGHYCKKTTTEPITGKCEKQIALGGACTGEFECVNNAFCHNKTCKEYFSLTKDTELVEQLLDDSYACEFSFVRKEELKRFCASRKYKAEAKDGVVLCNNNDLCEYDIGKSQVHKMKCLCGYNADGQGYCPYDTESNPSIWTNYYGAIKAAYANECHTENRFSCQESDFTKVQKKRASTNVAFYKAVDCALEVLSGGYLAVSILAIISFFI